MNILANKIYIHADSVIVQPLEQGLAIIEDETDKIIVLNITGAAIWNLFDGLTSCEQIVSEIALQFSTPIEQVVDEIYILIEQLYVNNLISEKGVDVDNT